MCKRCEGKGYIEVTDWVPYGSTNVPMVSIGLCPGCLEDGICPMCGEELPEEHEEGDTCPCCGWVDDPIF